MLEIIEYHVSPLKLIIHFCIIGIYLVTIGITGYTILQHEYSQKVGDGYSDAESENEIDGEDTYQQV